MVESNMFTKEELDKRQKGTVLIFKEGTTDKEIKEALKGVEHLLESFSYDRKVYRINEFCPTYTSPVWYCP